MKTLKTLILPLVLVLFFTQGCNDLFDEGDVEKEYTGPDQIAFADLQVTADEGSTISREVQLISANGLANSDIVVNIGVSTESTADPDDYTLSSNSVTISSGSASTSFNVALSSDDGDTDAEETLILTLSADGVQVAANFSSSTIFIQSAD